MTGNQSPAPTHAGKTIVILGGGVGGLSTANALRRRIGDEHRVVLVDKSAEHLFTPSLLWLMTGARRSEKLSKTLRAMAHPGVEVTQAEARGLDLERGRVLTDGSDLGFDALVVALGADLAPELSPGFTSIAHNIFDLEGAARFRDALRDFAGGQVVVAVSALPYKCPAAPYEAALLIDDVLRRRGVRGRSEVVVVTPEPQPMPVAGPVMGAALMALLDQRGIQFHPNWSLREINAERRELIAVDGARQTFDLLAGVPPHQAPQAIRTSPLANEMGWIPVDKHTLRTSHESVYALGDVATITLANGKPLPKAGVFAHAQGLVVARALAEAIQGRASSMTFDGGGYCWVELGGGKAAFASGDFYAEPNPVIQLRQPGRIWHLGKVAFERYWMGGRFEHAAAELALAAGSKVLRIPSTL